jgi:transcriptional regulator with XRE-family HTH domain
MNFSEKLQKLRKGKNLSQEQLAEELNVSRQAVSKWESGQGYPEIDKLILISDFFNVSLDALLKDNNETGCNHNTDTRLNLKDICLMINSSYQELPHHYQSLICFIIGCAAIIIIFSVLNQSYNVGEHLGKFLYYITH